MNNNFINHNSYLRILSSLVLVSIALYGICINDNFLLLTLCIVVFLITYEWVTITEDIKSTILKCTKSLFNVIIFMLSILSLQFSILFFIIIFILNIFSKNSSKKSKFFILFGPIYLCLPFIYLYEIKHFNNGIDIIIWFLLIIWTTDTFSYICGKFIGGKKLWPSLSPNKTWSGFLLGIIFGVIVSLICFYVKEYSIYKGIYFGFVLSFTTQLGDLFESWIKRKHLIKDSGKILPGHGGLLDRLDGLMISSLFLYIGSIIYG